MVEERRHSRSHAYLNAISTSPAPEEQAARRHDGKVQGRFMNPVTAGFSLRLAHEGWIAFREDRRCPRRTLKGCGYEWRMRNRRL
jgi:hypothetical protein